MNNIAAKRPMILGITYVIFIVLLSNLPSTASIVTSNNLTIKKLEKLCLFQGYEIQGPEIIYKS